MTRLFQYSGAAHSQPSTTYASPTVPGDHMQPLSRTRARRCPAITCSRSIFGGRRDVYKANHQSALYTGRHVERRRSPSVGPGSDESAGGDPPRPSEPVWTTGYWYVRLCRAVLNSPGPSGVLSASKCSPPRSTSKPMSTCRHHRLGSKRPCALSTSTSKSSRRSEPNPTPTADPGLVPLALIVHENGFGGGLAALRR